MIVKLLLLCATCAMAAAGVVGVGYAAPAYGPAIAPAFAAHAVAPAITTHTIAAPAIGHYAAPALAAPLVRAEPIDPNPAYSFSYGVSDPATGDRKDASETLQNGVVHGSYSLVEPDGHLRKVTYTADKINGFNAVVERTGNAHAVAAPLAVAAPVSRVIAAPAPLAVAPAPVAVAAPVARYTLPAANLSPWG